MNPVAGTFAVAAYRRQLAESADHIAAAIAYAAMTIDPVDLEALAIRLSDTARLALHLRCAVLSQETQHAT